MASYGYSSKLEGARAVGRDLPISTKHSAEVCRFIKGRSLKTAKKLLEEVMVKKRAVPYKKHTWDLGHKAGIGSGRYPVKACMNILKILESAETNAQFKGLNTSNLGVTHIAAQRASQPRHYGRHGGRTMKRTHIEVILQEQAKKEPAKKSDKKSSSTAKKVSGD